MRVLGFRHCVPGFILGVRRSFWFSGHAHTRVTNLFTNAVFSSPEVKFQVYEKLKYGEEK